jgi:hypothetical protein
MIGRDESNEVGILDYVGVRFERGCFEYRSWVLSQRKRSVGTVSLVPSCRVNSADCVCLDAVQK